MATENRSNNCKNQTYNKWCCSWLIEIISAERI